MQPLFPYYGSKHRGAKHYGPPRRDEVVEPFAGSAAYSLYWNVRRVALYDLSEPVCAAWHWLINCSEADVLALPDVFRSDEEWLELPLGPRQIVYWWCRYARCDVGTSLPKSYLDFTRDRRVTGRFESFVRYNRTKGQTYPIDRLADRVFWGPRRKRRIIEQKPMISEWTVEQADYRSIPLVEAHWHVDPPYQGKPGRGYIHNKIDFDALADWCRSLPGAVDVCENLGAEWLPFEPLYDSRNAGNRNSSREVVWRKDPATCPLFPAA